MIEFSFVSQVCQLWALNVKLQYCNVNTHTHTHTQTHTNYIWAVFLFYRKRYSGLPSLQNKCFLFLNLLDWHYQHTKEWWSLHYVHFCWILNCQNDVVSKFSRDKSTYCMERSNHWRCCKIKMTRPFQILEVPRLRQESLLNNNIRGTSFSLRWRDLLYEPSDGSQRTIPQILRLKHKLAALQRSAEELFVC